MRGTALAIALIAVGCIRTATVTCDDGTICREGTTCFAVTNGFTCVSPDEIVCGNGVVETGEVCDDANTVLGDGCSADCRSNETCDNHVIDPVKNVGGDLVANEQCDDGVADAHLSHDGCSSVCTSETAHWSDRRSVPTGRAYGVMVTDALRRRIVMFGGAPLGANGTGLGNYSNETWELSSEGWTRMPTALSPAPRARHAMAFDGENTVLFGGFSGSNLGDTWMLEGNTWTLVVGNGPSARAGHAMAYMPNVGIVLFGGFDVKALADTWVFANGAWRLVETSTAPPSREKHVMVYDPVRERIVMTGGAERDGKYWHDTWEFDGTQWSEINPTQAPALEDASAVFDRTSGHVIMQGGFGYGADPTSVPGGRKSHSETYSWNGTTWVVAPTTIPERHAGGIAADPLTGEPIVYAGVVTAPEEQQCLLPCTVTLKDAWRWTGSAWTVLDYREFPQLEGTAAAYDPDRRKVVVFGGASSSSGGQVQDTYELGAGSWRRVATTGPSARWHAAMVYGVFGTTRAMYLVGGRSGIAPSAETWKLADGAWMNVAPPGGLTARFLHAMAFDEKRGVIVLYGGATASGPGSDTWEFDGTSWSNKTPPAGGPGPRQGHAMVYDPIRQQVLQFGGQNDTGAIVGGLWAWSGTEWTQLVTSIEPPVRVGAAMAWDAARRRVVLFGGDGNDAWEWDGAAWSFISVFEPPIARVDHVLVRSPTGDGVMSIGGFANIVENDVLHLVHDSLAPYAACRSMADDDLDGATGCDDPDCWVVCTPWCPPGASCDASAPSCGDGTCSAPRETCGICEADCGACP